VQIHIIIGLPRLTTTKRELSRLHHGGFSDVFGIAFERLRAH